MHILGLVFSLLLSLSFILSALQYKRSNADRIRSGQLGHFRVQRKLQFSRLEKTFAHLQASKPVHPKNTADPQGTKTEKKVKEPDTNPLCARLNLWPLIQDGKENHALLYKKTFELLDLLYGEKVFSNNREELKSFLDFILLTIQKEITEKGALSFCKLDLHHPKYQKLFYRLLKGSKESSFVKNLGFPPLLEYITLTPSKTSICMQDAHPYMLALFVGKQKAWPLFEKIHTLKKKTLSKEIMESICREAGILSDSLMFIHLKSTKCPKDVYVVISEKDAKTNIILKETVFN